MKKSKINERLPDVPKQLLENLERQKDESLLLEIRAVQSSFAIPLFDERQELLLVNLLNSKPYHEAYTQAGYSKQDLPIIEKFLSSKSIARVIFYFKNKKENQLKFTREKLSEMAMQCYHERLSSAEGLRAIEVLSKLWGLNKENPGSRITINNQQNNLETNRPEVDHERYLKTLSTDQLKNLASDKLSNVTIEHKKDLSDDEKDQEKERQI